MSSPVEHPAPLKLLPAYIGCTSLEEALAHPRHRAVLWLEVLFNDQLDETALLQHPSGREAYDEACRGIPSFVA